MLGRISYITLWVNEYDACLAFYRDVLGLPLEAADENFPNFLHRARSSIFIAWGISHLFEAVPWRSTSKFRMWMLCMANCSKEECNSNISLPTCLGARVWLPFAIRKEMQSRLLDPLILMKP